MAHTFTVQIATPGRVVLEKEAVSLVAPAYDGYLGIKARHAPLAAELQTGALTVTYPDGRRDALAVAGGFLAVADNVATILADAAELASEIDVARAEAAEARARERLGKVHGSEAGREIDDERARAALLRAANRLTIARRRP